MTHDCALVLPLAILVAACGAPAAPGETETTGNAEARLRPGAPAPVAAAGQWAIGKAPASLTFIAQGGERMMRLSCAGDGTLEVGLPGARPIASEERLSVGGGGEVEALVAEPDAQGGGIGASGTVPAALAAMLRAGPGASYGATAVGPLPAVPAEAAEAFVAACRKPAAVASTSPCTIQDGRPLTIAPLRAVGTEPFWGAAIDGRCVTYSTPEDAAGTRVWTRANPDGGMFSGALGGKPFVLQITRAACSDGMSDRRYPLTATLLVGGERRRGCASPL